VTAEWLLSSLDPMVSVERGQSYEIGLSL